jgi:peptidyl-dipeptidase Dcp
MMWGQLLALLLPVAPIAVTSCGGTPKDPVSPTSATPDAGIAMSQVTVDASAPPAAKPNPLLAKWEGPNGGVPAFDKYTVADLGPALEIAMAEKLADIERIANDPSPPTFENTIVALEHAGRTMERVQAVYGIVTSTMNDDAAQAVQRDMEPKLAGLDDKISQNAKLFARVAAVYDSRNTLKLTPEQSRLLWLDYVSFVRSGAKLDDAGKKRIGDINQRLAAIYTTFSQNVLAEEGSQTVVLEKEEDLAGLSDSLKKAAASAAEAHGQKGKWVITNTRSSVDPFLTYSTRRDLRQKVWKMFEMRGDNGDAHDNNATITEILKLRAERAKLLGYPTHAHWRLELSMAKTPERATELMEAVWKPAVARVHEEVADMQKIADREGASQSPKETKGAPGATAGTKEHIKIEAWDYRYYAEKVRKAKYDLDQNEVKPYLSLESLREGMFWVAGQLFGFNFAEVTDKSVPTYHPDVRVFRVTGEGGKHVGYWYFDPYSRPGKTSGAWMNEYRPQSRAFGDVPVIVSNNANFVKGAPGEPVLISWDDARTLFHEFGHALHGLNSSVTYPSLAGTNVARDYVEFPSQLLERWLATPEVLSKYALHVQTKQPIPDALVKKLAKSEAFNQGFLTVEYLSSALVDMKMHTTDKPIDPRAFEKDTLAALGMPKEMIMRHRSPHFQHVFSGDGYSAGYYSYLWSDTLSADAYEAFIQGKGPYDKDVSKRLHDNVFSVGNSIDAADGYRAFRGKDAGIGALMRHRGFPVPPAAPSSKPAAPKKK